MWVSRPRPSGPTPSWGTHRQPARPAERTAAWCRRGSGSRRPAECSTAAAQSAAELSQGVCGGVQGGGSPAGGIWDPLRRRRGVPGAPRCQAANGPLWMPCSRPGGVAGRAACCTAEGPTDGRSAPSLSWLKWENPSALPEKPGYLPERATDRGAAHPAAGRLQAATVRKRCGM